MAVQPQDAAAGEAIDRFDHGRLVLGEEGPDRAVVGSDDRGRDQVGKPQRKQVLAARPQPARAVDQSGAPGIDEIQDQRRGEVGLVERRLGAHEDRRHLIQPHPLRLPGGEPPLRHRPSVIAAGRDGARRTRLAYARARPCAASSSRACVTQTSAPRSCAACMRPTVVSIDGSRPSSGSATNAIFMTHLR